jgi:dienelactone hydrolase
MTRRQLATLAAGAAALRTQAKAAQVAAKPSTYTGALDGFESQVAPAAFDPVDYTRKLYESAPLQLAFRAGNRRDAEAWQKKLRAKVVELIGGFPSQRAPLAPKTLETRDFPGYRREKAIFESRPGSAVLVYLLTPLKGQAPFPTMISIPGHGRGVDDIVGIDAQGRDRTDKDGYQHDFAIQCVEHGMAAAAIEPMGFGCRRDARTKAKGLGVSACQPTAGAALLLGQTMVGWRVYDIMRTLDWIATRKELDANRTGCMGISGGGTVTLFTAALEPRIKAAFVSGYLNTFRDSILSLSHCIDNYVPGILNWAEMYDIAGLIAPRPLFVESGEKDEIFPVGASKASFERVKKIYEVFGAADRTEQEIFPAAHSFHGVRGLAFMKQRL